MIWKLPPRIKVFEALGAVADERVHLTASGATVSSSDGTKSYAVRYDEAKNAITSNDNGSRWQGYLGYPSIALLMKLGKLPFDQALADGLKGIAWKAINTKYKNDWAKTETDIFENLDREVYEQFAERVLRQITDLKLNR